MTWQKLLLALILAVGTALPGHGEHVDHGEYRIHYTTFPSTLIPADVAAAHDIVRADNRIVLNVSVLKGRQPSVASIRGDVINLLNQRFELTFDEVNEADAVYYLANHVAVEQDILRFNIVVQPPDTEPYPITFLRRYD